jgi:hypothetical protein
MSSCQVPESATMRRCLSLIREAGYEGAVSGFGGFVWPGGDDYLLPREAVPWFRGTLHLEMHLSGCLHWLYALRGRAGSCPPHPYADVLAQARSRVEPRPEAALVGRCAE